MATKKAKKATINELGLSTRTRNLVLNRFPTMQDAVLEGRRIAYLMETYPGLIIKFPKWKLEFAEKLTASGYTRPADDFTPTFVIGVLHNAIYGKCSCFPSSIEELTNKEYESFDGLTWEEVDGFKFSIREHLSEMTYRILCHRFLDERIRSLESVGQEYHMTRERVRQYEAKALRMLKTWKVTPVIFGRMEALYKY